MVWYDDITKLGFKDWVIIIIITMIPIVIITPPDALHPINKNNITFEMDTPDYIHVKIIGIDYDEYKKKIVLSCLVENDLPFENEYYRIERIRMGLNCVAYSKNNKIIGLSDTKNKPEMFCVGVGEPEKQYVNLAFNLDKRYYDINITDVDKIKLVYVYDSEAKYYKP